MLAEILGRGRQKETSPSPQDFAFHPFEGRNRESLGTVLIFQSIFELEDNDWHESTKLEVCPDGGSWVTGRRVAAPEILI